MNTFFVPIQAFGHLDPVELVDILSFTKAEREAS